MKNREISNFMKIRQLGAELFHADRQTDMTKLIVAFPIFRTYLKPFLHQLFHVDTSLNPYRYTSIYNSITGPYLLRDSTFSISVTGANRLRWLCGNFPDLHLEWLNQISAWFPAVLIEVLCDFCQFLRSNMVILTLNRPRQRLNSNFS